MLSPLMAVVLFDLRTVLADLHYVEISALSDLEVGYTLFWLKNYK